MPNIVGCLTSLLSLDIPLIYCVHLNSLIICCIFSGDINLSFGISVSSKLFSECIFLKILMHL